MRWWPGVVMLLGIGLAVAVSVHPGPLPGELGYVQWLQGLDEPIPTFADIVWTTTGTEAALVVAAGPAAWLILRRERDAAIAAAIAALTLLVVQPTVKELVDRPRPSPQLVTQRVETESTSFPSGHAMSTTTVWGAVAGSAWARRRRVVAGAAVLPIALTYLASGVQGVHWPTDATAGTMFGAMAAWVIVPRLRLESRVGTGEAHARAGPFSRRRS